MNIKLYKIIFLVFLVLAGCVHQLEEQIDKAVIPGELKTVFITSSVSVNNLNIDSIYKFDNNIKDTLSDRIQNDSIKTKKMPLRLELRHLYSDKYPDTIIIDAVVFDTLGRTISGLAPPYFKGKGIYKDYWQKITDSYSGLTNNISEYEVTEIREHTRDPFAMCFVLDHSPSMGNVRATKLQEVVKKMLTKLRLGDYAGVVKFTATIKNEVPLTNDKQKYTNDFLVDGLKGYGGGTALFDGAIAGIKELKKAPSNFKKVMVLFTDGLDNSSKSKIDSVEYYAHKENVLIYSISYGLGMADIDVMMRLSKSSGGKFYQLISTKQFPYVFADIYIGLNNYYKIKYKPPVCDGLHKASVFLKFSGSNLPVLSDTGWYDKSVFTKYDTVGKITFINIEFDFGKSVIKKGSENELEKIAMAMKLNSQLKIRVLGHTDNIGDDKFNMDLSNKRAEAVVNALVKMGVKRNHLTFHGFGSTKPLVPNDSEENRQRNRRTEFEIIEN